MDWMGTRRREGLLKVIEGLLGGRSHAEEKKLDHVVQGSTNPPHHDIVCGEGKGDYTTVRSALCAGSPISRRPLRTEEPGGQHQLECQTLVRSVFNDAQALQRLGACYRARTGRSPLDAGLAGESPRTEARADDLLGCTSQRLM